MDRKESDGSREQHLPPVKGESVVRVFVRPLHGHFRCRRAETRRRHARRATRYVLKPYKEDKIGAWPDTHCSNKLLSAQGYLTPSSESHQQKYQHLCGFLGGRAR